MARQSAQGIEEVEEMQDKAPGGPSEASEAMDEAESVDSASAFDLDPSSPEAEVLDATSAEGENGDLDASEDSIGEQADVGEALGQTGANDDLAEKATSELFQLEQPLVESATRLVEERARYEQLLASAREGRERVSPEIFERVVSDYESRLETVEAEYSPIRDEILAHVRGVMEEERTVRARLEEINEVVEELRFRRQLGEFDDDEFDRRRQESTGELTELDEKLSGIESLYRTVRSLLGHDAQDMLESNGVSSQSNGTAGGDEQARVGLDTQELSEVAPSHDPAFDKTAVLQTIPPEGSQSQTVIVAGPGAAVLENVQAGRSGRVMITPVGADAEAPVALDQRELVVGRSTTCDLVLKGATVSRRHALLRRSGEAIEVEDISSGGGVLVNGERIERLATVELGDQLQIGNVVLRVDS